MKKYLNKKTYGFIVLFFVFAYVAYTQKSYIINDLFVINEAMQLTKTDIKIAEKKLAVAKTKIEDIKNENAKNIKEKIDINEIKKKIKRQIKAYNLLNTHIKINFNDIKEQTKYLDAFVAEFEIISSGGETKQIANALDFLGLYGVVEIYKNNKATVYISLKNEHPKQEIVKQEVVKKETKDTIIQQPKQEEKIKAVQKAPIIKKDTTKKVEKIKPDTIKTDTIKEQNKTSFDKKFLNADKEKFTINLFTSLSNKESFDFLNKFKLIDNSISFSFGKPETLYKTMYGIYETKEEAQKAIDLLPLEMKANNPRIEKIAIKQALYKKYHQNNGESK